MNDRPADSDSSNSDDWDFEETDDDPYRYSNSRNDLSESINSGQRIRDLRMLDGLSVDEMARRAGIPSTELLAIEAGMLQVDSCIAEKLASAMELSVKDVWGDQF